MIPELKRYPPDLSEACLNPWNEEPPWNTSRFSSSIWSKVLGILRKRIIKRLWSCFQKEERK